MEPNVIRGDPPLDGPASRIGFGDDGDDGVEGLVDGGAEDVEDEEEVEAFGDELSDTEPNADATDPELGRLFNLSIINHSFIRSFMQRCNDNNVSNDNDGNEQRTMA